MLSIRNIPVIVTRLSKKNDPSTEAFCIGESPSASINSRFPESTPRTLVGKVAVGFRVGLAVGVRVGLAVGNLVGGLVVGCLVAFLLGFLVGFLLAGWV